MKIGFIGLGNMAKAMLAGILKQGEVKPQELFGSAKTEETRNKIHEMYGIEVTGDNKKVAKEADILVLAIKPQMFAEVIPEIRNHIKKDALILSLAAGKTMDQIEGLLERKLKVVRCMPNTPALVGEGCTGVCRNELVNDGEMEQCLTLLRSFGIAEEVPERLMDAVIGVSGSSPAYVFMFLEALADGAVKAGMPRAQAYRFAAQSVLGSAKLMLETGKHPGELKDMVCSPQGTTIEAVQMLEESGFRGTVMSAVEACVNRSKNM